MLCLTKFVLIYLVGVAPCAVYVFQRTFSTEILSWTNIIKHTFCRWFFLFVCVFYLVYYAFRSRKTRIEKNHSQTLWVNNCWFAEKTDMTLFFCDVEYFIPTWTYINNSCLFLCGNSTMKLAFITLSFRYRCKYSWPFGIMDRNNIGITSRRFRNGLYWWNFVKICAIYSMWSTWIFFFSFIFFLK